MKPKDPLIEAIQEDKRERSTFDPWGFAAFFPEENEEDVKKAWRLYCAYHQRGN